MENMMKDRSKDEYMNSLIDHLEKCTKTIHGVIQSLHLVEKLVLHNDITDVVFIPDSFKKRFEQVLRDNKVNRRRFELFLAKIKDSQEESFSDAEIDKYSVSLASLHHSSNAGREEASEIINQSRVFLREYKNQAEYDSCEDQDCSPQMFDTQYEDFSYEEDFEDDWWN